MTGDVFDIGRSDWEISLTEFEIDQIWPLVARCMAERSEELVWLIARPDRTRTWLFHMETVWGWRNTFGEPTNEQVVVPIPIVVLFNILHAYEDVDDVTLYYNSNEDALVVRMGTATQFVDFPRHHPKVDVALLYTHFTNAEDQEIIAQIEQEDFQKFLPMHQAKPPHVEPDSTVIAPYLTMQFSQGMFRATTDWRRAGGPRITTAHPAEVVEELTFSCVGGVLGRIFGGDAEEGTLTVSIDADYEQVFITYGNTGCCIDIQYEHVMRWIFSIYRAIDTLDDVEVFSKPGPCMSPTIPFSYKNVAMYASIITGTSDLEDRVRILAVIADTAGENEQTLREINAINTSLTDAKLLLQEDAVVAVIDVHPSDAEAIHNAVARLDEVATRFDGIGAWFASYA